MRNHYVSQLIMRRYSEKLNTFKYGDNYPSNNVESKRVFFKTGIFSDENEKNLAKNIETPIARLLDEKVIDKDIITLTRKELYLLKHFFLIDSIRTQYDSFAKLIRNFDESINKYLSMPFNNKEALTDLPSLKDMNLSDREILDLSMQLVIETRSIEEMILHPYAFLEIVCWSLPFYQGFLTFWDTEEEEFILTDNGMTTEYETTHYVFNGLDISKTSYLLNKIRRSIEEKNEKLVLTYSDLLNKNILMFENFNMFNLSSNRVMLLLNPFFRLYSENGFNYFDYETKNTFVVKPDKPNIWPSIIQNQKAFNVPENQYRFPNKGLHVIDDFFIYKPYKLSRLETIHLNSLFLEQTRDCIGYNNLDQIIDSIKYFVIILKAENLARCNNLKSIADMKYVQHPIEKLIRYANFNKIIGREDGKQVFQAITHNRLRDLNNNEYIYEKLISEIDTHDDFLKHFGFMGKTKEEIKANFKRKLEGIKNRSFNIF